MNHVYIMYLSPLIPDYFFSVKKRQWGRKGGVSWENYIHPCSDGKCLFASKERQTRFYIRKADQSFSKENDDNYTCRIFLCKRTNFLLPACCIQYICLYTRRKNQAAFLVYNAAWMAGNVSLPYIFILYMFVYTNYITMYEHRFCYICLFLFPTKLAHNGDSFVQKKKYACNFFLIILFQIAYERNEI